MVAFLVTAAVVVGILNSSHGNRAFAAVEGCTPDPGYTACVRYTVTGSDQAFTVPPLVTSVSVKAWGAGGAGSTNGSSIGAPGGSGGYVEGVLNVTPGDQYVVVVGEGGGADGGVPADCDAAYGFGGRCAPLRAGRATHVDGGGGGGLSGLFTGSAIVTETDFDRAVFVAGGGGAGEGAQDCGAASAAGGAGGNAESGGMPTMAGVPGELLGATGNNPTGGGGGYRGGDATARLLLTGCPGPTGNGGSNFIAPGVIDPANLAGTEATANGMPDINQKDPPNTGALQYIASADINVAGVGVGQVYTATSQFPRTGGPGLVVLQWVNTDFGDAPDSYGTLFEDGGPNHISSANFLGASRDIENDGTPGVGADADGADEDGVAVFERLTTSDPTYSVAVTCTGAGTIAGWIDFDINGTFDADERTSAACADDTVSLTWSSLPGIATGETYARFRFAAVESEILAATGPASDGEVEDYALTIQEMPVIDIGKTSSEPGNLTPGGTVTYTVVVTNTGAWAATDLTIADPLPAGIDSVTWNCAAAGGATCPDDSGNLPLNETVPTLPVGGMLTYTIVGNVSAAPPAAVVNTAAVTGEVFCEDGDAAPCSASASNPPAPIVSIVKTADPQQVEPGDPVSFVVTARNVGTVAADGSTVADAVPAGLAGFDTWTCEGEGGAICPAANGSGALNETTATFPVGSLLRWTITATVSGNPTATITNTASITPAVDGICDDGGAPPCIATAVLNVELPPAPPPPPPPPPTPTPTATPTPTPTPIPTATATATPPPEPIVVVPPRVPKDEVVTITIRQLTLAPGCDASLRIVDYSETTYEVELETLSNGDLQADWDVPPGPNGTELTVYLVVDGDDCDEPSDDEIGTISRVDPSGIVVDIVTECPIEGADVELQRLVGDQWIRADPAAVEQGTEIIAPQLNPQHTLGDGRYGWDVVPGEWRVHVTHPDYHPQTSRSVTVPPPVLDLDLFTEPIGEPLGCSPVPSESGHGPASGERPATVGGVPASIGEIALGLALLAGTFMVGLAARRVAR